MDNLFEELFEKFSELYTDDIAISMEISLHLKLIDFFHSIKAYTDNVPNDMSTSLSLSQTKYLLKA